LQPTIKSRCQTIRFSTLPEEKIIEKIRETGLNERPAKYLARLAQGSLGAACQWAELELADANLYRTKKELISSLADCRLVETLELAEWLLDESKEIADVWGKLEAATSRTDINRRAAKTLLQIVISALHDAMILNVTPDKPIVNFDQRERIKELAERFDTEQLAEKIADCYETMRWIDAAVNERLIFERLLLNLAASDRIRA
jgi:DNA polymerase III gamma/tau subunit